MNDTTTAKTAQIRFGSPFDRRTRFWLVLSCPFEDLKEVENYCPWFTDGYPSPHRYSPDFSKEYMTAHDPAWVITTMTLSSLWYAAGRLRTLGFDIKAPSDSFVRRWIKHREKFIKEEEIRKCHVKTCSPSV